MTNQQKPRKSVTIKLHAEGHTLQTALLAAKRVIESIETMKIPKQSQEIEIRPLNERFARAFVNFNHEMTPEQYFLQIKRYWESRAKKD